MARSEEYGRAERVSGLVILDRLYSRFWRDLHNYKGEARREAGKYCPAIKKQADRLRSILGSLEPVLGALGLLRSPEHGELDHEIEALEEITVALIDKCLKRLTTHRSEHAAEKRLAEVRDAVIEIEETVRERHTYIRKELENEVRPRVLDRPEGKETEDLTVVVVDMVEYTPKAIAVFDLGDVKGVRSLNDSIHDTLETALKQSGNPPEAIPLIPTGDGAILFFRSPAEALAFGGKLHELAAVKAARAAHEKHYRIGVATGATFVGPRMVKGRYMGIEAAGLPIVDGVRLEQDCPPGSILMCGKTKDAIPKRDQADLERHEVHAKDGRNLEGWKRPCVPPPPEVPRDSERRP